jgi:uncharacterized membrane protein YcjF (UPF0283 family)
MTEQQNQTKHKRSSTLNSVVMIIVAIVTFCVLVLWISGLLGDQDWINVVTTRLTGRSLAILSVLVFLCSRFIKLYFLEKKPCDNEDTCAVNKMKRNNWVMLGLGTVVLIILLALY